MPVAGTLSLSPARALSQCSKPLRKNGPTAGSAKFELLFDLLPELIDEGRRVLLFSQFTTMLGLIEAEAQRRGIDDSRLTGRNVNRDAAISCFR